jgi:ferrous iron transport protein B
LIGQRIDGEIDFGQSFGLLTTGIYVPIVMVMPFVLLFYFILSITEDIGYLPRLAVLVDGVMHRIGLHGSSIISVMLGLGCNVPGILSTRILESRRQRFIQIVLLSIGVPCLAMTAMIFGILGRYGVQYIAIVFITLFIVYVLLGLALKRFIKGESPELLLEIPAYRLPYMRAVLKKTWMRMKQFFKEAVPFVMFGVLIANLLYVSGAIEALSWFFTPVVVWCLGLKGEATAALMMGFLRKDIAAGMLIPLGMSAAQLTVATTVISMFFPCIATFTVIYKELGLKDLLKASMIMVSVSFIVGVVLRLLLIGI